MGKEVKAFIVIVVSICTIIGAGVVGALSIKKETRTETRVESISYHVTTVKDDTIREGERVVKQEGKNGKKDVTYEVYYENGVEKKKKKIIENIITSAVEEIVALGTKKYYLCSNGSEYETMGEKDECEKRIRWEQARDETLRECNADPNKFNCWYDEYPGEYIHWSYYPLSSTTKYRGGSNTIQVNNGRSGAICWDGTRSNATGRGACSHHGGVYSWI